MIYSKWNEIHGLNDNNETVKVISHNADIRKFYKLCEITPAIYRALAFISYRKTSDGTHYIVREIMYK